jgi:hypothetical protein
MELKFNNEDVYSILDTLKEKIVAIMTQIVKDEPNKKY